MLLQTMTRQALALVFTLAAAAACGDRKLDADCQGMCEPFHPDLPDVGACKDGSCSPTLFECSLRDQVETCAEACEAQGAVCAENACGGGTYLIYLTEVYCSDGEGLGPLISHGCDEPIDWQPNHAVRCCCKQ